MYLLAPRIMVLRLPFFTASSGWPCWSLLRVFTCYHQLAGRAGYDVQLVLAEPPIALQHLQAELLQEAACVLLSEGAYFVVFSHTWKTRA